MATVALLVLTVAGVAAWRALVLAVPDVCEADMLLRESCCLQVFPVLTMARFTARERGWQTRRDPTADGFASGGRGRGRAGVLPRCVH